MSKRRGPISLIVELLRTHPEMVALGVLFALSAGVLLSLALEIDSLPLPFIERRY